MNAAQAVKKLRDVYGDEALKERQCRNWFDKFRSGNFFIKDDQRSGRPTEVDDDQIKVIIKSDRHIPVREIKCIAQQSKIIQNVLDSLRSSIFHMNWKKFI